MVYCQAASSSVVWSGTSNTTTGASLTGLMTRSKTSSANASPSEVTTFSDSVPLKSCGGVPEKVRVAASKLSQNPFDEALGDLLPSEVYDRNCFTGLANAKRRELGMRYEIGIDNMLWGTDFPHPEGTWPNTREALETTFFDIPVEETRRILGLATADAFGFDVEALRPLAEKIGPTPTDLGQLSDTQTAADLTARWATVREVGRHWLTGHDFPLYGEPPEG